MNGDGIPDFMMLNNLYLFVGSVSGANSSAPCAELHGPINQAPPADTLVSEHRLPSATSTATVRTRSQLEPPGVERGTPFLRLCSSTNLDRAV